jgi:indolepyruvate decarboxylase
MMDAPESLKKFADIFADFDYGERGPRNPSKVAALEASPSGRHVAGETA